jgi:hypothetical protein
MTFMTHKTLTILALAGIVKARSMVLIARIAISFMSHNAILAVMDSPCAVFFCLK